MDSNTPRSGAGLAIGFGLVVLGLIIFLDSVGMQVPPAYARVGPQAFPYFIAFALATLGAYFIWNATASGARREIVAEGFDNHVPKGYVYFAMAFSLTVEMLNIRMRKKAAHRVELNPPRIPGE